MTSSALRQLLRTVIVTTLMLSATATSALAQSWVTYDASLGTFPPAQCFPEFAWEITKPPAIINQQLCFSTIGGGHGAKGAYLYWDRTDATIDWSAGVAIEALCAIVSSEQSVSEGTNWPRLGYSVAISDLHGNWIDLGFADDLIMLRNNPYIGVDGVNCRQLNYPVAGSEHLYRVEINSNGADLFIDGTLQDLHIPISTSFSTTPSDFYFGDGTGWANSESSTRFVRFSVADPLCCVSSCPGDVSNNGTVDVDDLLILINAWGDCSQDCCPGDLAPAGNPNGTVDVDDLLALINAWGDCG